MADSAASGWYQDPDGVHQLRFHDGADWTVHVANDGVMSQAPRGVAPEGPGASAPGAPRAGQDWTAQLAVQYGQACTAVLDTAQAALAVANDAAGAWNMARKRPQHEISIRTFTQLAERKGTEFGQAYRLFQAAVAAARAAGSKLSGQFGDPAEAEDCLALSISLENLSEVGAAIEFLRVDFPADALGFRELIPRVNHAINTNPGFGEPGFQGNIYSDGRPDRVNRL